MAVDKLVDSTQLDSGLTSVANAIRAKSGGSSQLAFPAGFVSEIQAIPSGGGGPHEVPDGYTQLKYLQGSGTQFINTGFAPTLEMRLQVTGARLVATGYNALAGSTSPDIYIPMGNGVYASRYYAKFGNSGEKTGDRMLPVGSDLPPVITVDKTQALFESDGMASNTIALNATGLGTVSESARIYLFTRNGTAIAAGRIWRAKIWDNDVLVRDMVPAKRDADDVLGMYDIVNDVFYTNAGTGVFTGGEYE